MEMKPYIVYVKSNDAGYIIAVNSSVFLTDTTGWVEIDSGYGDRFGHAQGNYFPEPIVTMGGAYRYKLVDGVPVECSEEEIAQQEDANKPEHPELPTLDERVATLETDTADMAEALEMILNGVTE